MSAVISLPNNRWRDELQINAEGALRKNLFNAVIIARDHPEMRGTLAYDEFRQAIMKKRKMPWGSEPDEPFNDIDVLDFVNWAQGEKLPMSKELAEQSIQIVGDKSRYHPVRDWLETLEWDGVERIDHWLHDMMGVEEQEFTEGDEGVDDYVRQAGAKWLISAVARVMQPGCKVDHMLVLEGDQGTGKSTAVRFLAGNDLFSDNLSDIRNKDSSMELQGVWIIELAELDHLKRTESAAMKAWLTKTRDRFRPPFGKSVQDFARQCIFVGTVNGSSYLKDDTGNRRYWPIRTGKIDTQAIKDAREQLWAEALVRYRAGDGWHLSDKTIIAVANQQQKDRIEADPWQDPIRSGLQDRAKPFKLSFALSIVDPQKERWTKVHQMRVGQCLVALGFEKKRRRVRGENTWFWGTNDMWSQWDEGASTDMD